MLAKRLKGKVIQNIDSTAVGSGVAELLIRMAGLLNELGVDTRWDVIRGGATDAPEGNKVFAEVREKPTDNPDIHILLLPPASDIEINAIQRTSTVILQKSLREGFGLIVAEALWKANPVVASVVGGIPLQITHKYSGLLSHTAYWVRQLLHSPEYV